MNTDVATQTRCPHCKGEQYVINVIGFSFGVTPCHLCGQLSRPMSDAEWRAALTESPEAQRP